MKNFMQGLIGLAVMAGFFFAMGFFMYAAVKGMTLEPTLKDILLQLVGSLNTLAGLVVGYHYGSSKGSTMKDETIKNISEGQTQ